jgi:NADPH:quinone reductase-like Zn-dependent oxidoreductase
VRDLTVGERVMALCDHGAFAEEMLTRESEVLPIPASMDWTTAAGFPIAYGTAHGALTWHAGLKAGQTLLVHGAGGGVGLAAVEVGKTLGARVIATAGGAAKLGLAEAHGADALIDSRQEDIRQRVLALTDGRGADVVLDPVGGEVFEASLRATAWGGRILVQEHRRYGRLLGILSSPRPGNGGRPVPRACAVVRGGQAAPARKPCPAPGRGRGGPATSERPQGGRQGGVNLR